MDRRKIAFAVLLGLAVASAAGPSIEWLFAGTAVRLAQEKQGYNPPYPRFQMAAVGPQIVLFDNMTNAFFRYAITNSGIVPLGGHPIFERDRQRLRIPDPEHRREWDEKPNEPTDDGAADEADPQVRADGGRGTFRLVGDRDRLSVVAKRVEQIRASVFLENLPTILQSRVKISENDYLLMGCDNSCAARNFPDVPRDQREVGVWMAGGTDLDGSRFGNASGTIDPKTGRMIVESFYTTLPRKQYQASPREVAWHYFRVRELRSQGMPVDERVATMKREAAQKPWDRQGRVEVKPMAWQEPQTRGEPKVYQQEMAESRGFEALWKSWHEIMRPENGEKSVSERAAALDTLKEPYDGKRFALRGELVRPTPPRPGQPARYLMVPCIVGRSYTSGSRDDYRVYESAAAVVLTPGMDFDLRLQDGLPVRVVGTVRILPSAVTIEAESIEWTEVRRRGDNDFDSIDVGITAKGSLIPAEQDADGYPRYFLAPITKPTQIKALKPGLIPYHAGYPNGIITSEAEQLEVYGKDAYVYYVQKSMWGPIESHGVAGGVRPARPAHVIPPVPEAFTRQLQQQPRQPLPKVKTQPIPASVFKEIAFPGVNETPPIPPNGVRSPDGSRRAVLTGKSGAEFSTTVRGSRHRGRYIKVPLKNNLSPPAPFPDDPDNKPPAKAKPADAQPLMLDGKIITPPKPGEGEGRPITDEPPAPAPPRDHQDVGAWPSDNAEPVTPHKNWSSPNANIISTEFWYGNPFQHQALYRDGRIALDFDLLLVGEGRSAVVYVIDKNSGYVRSYRPQESGELVPLKQDRWLLPDFVPRKER